MNAIFSVFHKNFYTPKNSIIKPILVGLDKNSIALKTTKKIFRDDNGENISVLNPFFCELTALFWVWKNFDQRDDEIVGMAHYRRYLFEKNSTHVSTKLKKIYYRFSNLFLSDADKIQINIASKIASQKSIEKILQSHDLILPFPIHFRNQNNEVISVKEHYQSEHSGNDWLLIEKILKKNHPDYSKTFDNYQNGKKSMICNMFITRRDIMNKYCEWLFPNIFEFYEETSISTDSYQARSVGFIAERLQNIYFLHNFEENKIYYMNQY